MKILMVLDHEFPSDIRVEKEIQTLTSAGHSIDLACFTQKNRMPIDESLGYKIFRKPISKFRLKTSVGALKFPFYFNFWHTFLDQLLKEGNYQAIHIHDLPLAKVGYKLSKRYHIKFILDLHENWPVLMKLSPHTKSLLGRLLHSNRQWLEYEKKYASLADGLVVVADEMKSRLLSKGVSNKNIFTVPNTTDLNIYNNLKSNRPDPNFITLLYTGGINKHRGLELIINGLGKMNLPDNFRFWIVGSGKNEPSLKKLVSDLKIEKQVIFFGWKQQFEVFELILKADITLISHIKNEHSDNTSPNKIFHYMLAKKPVLATNCNYIQNIVEQTECGIIYNNNRLEDFTEKLKFLMDNPSKRKYLGNNGFNAVIKNYNWENTSKNLIALYKNLD
jgi:glycosyltransferase involved in cell wall biosynthesis